jgi:hypothetical protein
MSDDLFGGFFDFNGDGRTDIGEEWIAYQIFKDCTGQPTDDFNFHLPRLSSDCFQAPAGSKDVQAAGENPVPAPASTKKSSRGTVAIKQFFVCSPFIPDWSMIK